MKRPLYLAVGGLCLVLFAIVVIELVLPISNVAASTGDRSVDQVVGDGAVTGDIDSLVAAILERPLFAPDRRGPPAPKNQDEIARPADRSAPEITGRLGGITIGPEDEREAVFMRGDGEKPLVVKEGDDVDGWTVSSIQPGHVLLTSAFGQREIQPTFGTPGDAPVHPRPQAAKETAGPQAQTGNPPAQPLANRRAPPPRSPFPGTARPSSGATPMAHRPPPLPAARRREAN